MDGASPPEAGRRALTARGTLINSAYQIFFAVVNLIRRVGVAAFLTQEQFGIWGILLASLLTLTWLKQVGIVDKYVQQQEPDQELAFQKAFSMELMMSIGYFILAAAALPLFALAYGHEEIILPGLLLASSMIVHAFQAPWWIRYRRLDYMGQRRLTGIDPLVSASAMFTLGALGMGYWGLVLGSLLGTAVSALVCVATSPYRLRFRLDRATVRSYVSFSWPLLALGLTQLVIVQATLLVANHAVGLAAVGAIGLVTSIAAFANRVDGILSQTIYPAVCAVADRRAALNEIFLKSNRVALMWGMPFAVALALFADALVRYVYGPEWASTVTLFVVVGLACGVGQLAFNWSVFMRAVGRTRPMFVASLWQLAVFAFITLPLMLLFGLDGYAGGFVAATVVHIVVRTIYMRRLLGTFDVVRQGLRGIAPAMPGAALVLGGRALLPTPGGVARLFGELIIYALVVIFATYFLERPLIRELWGYLKSGVSRSSATAVPGGAGGS